MRFLKAFILLVALFVVSIKGQTYSTDVNAFVIRGGPGSICGSADSAGANRIPESTNGICTSACGGNYFKISSDLTVYPSKFTLYTYSADNTTCQTPQHKSEPFSCPVFDPTSPKQVQFNVAVSDTITYSLQCIHQVVTATETPAAGNSADKVAVSIAIIFGALISLLAL